MPVFNKRGLSVRQSQFYTFIIRSRRLESCLWIIIKIKASAKESMVSGVKGDDIRSVSRKVVTRERVMVTLKFVVLSKKKRKSPGNHVMLMIITTVIKEHV